MLWRMTSMLEDILFIGKAESQRLEFRPAATRLVQLCERATVESALGKGTSFMIELPVRG
jgi:hypothetical protein